MVFLIPQNVANQADPNDVHLGVQVPFCIIRII